MRKGRNKIILHPIMAFLILICITILLSGILGRVVGLGANYNAINSIRGDIDTTTVSVNSLLNLSGLKSIFKNTVSNFASFAPLSMLLILLIGIGIMDKSGFLQSFFTLLTKKSKKSTVTFVLSFLIVIASIMGDISFLIFIPITALFFKYSKRNPKAGIIMSFAGLTCANSINIFMNSIDSALINYTEIAAISIDSTYTITNAVHLFVMIVLALAASILIAYITEKHVIPNLGKYEDSEEVLEEDFYLDKKKKRGLLFSLTIAVIYLLIFIYNIIPGLPWSGNLLDYSQNYYIDKLFGFNSFFNQGFVFVVTMLFFLCGFFYGIGAKTIRSNQDVAEFLGHSLDDIGQTLVLIFFASTFISIFKETNIGSVITALLANFVAQNSFGGIPLIIITFIISAIVTIFVPSGVTSWSILSGVIVPVFMNSGMSPEFAELVFKGGQSLTFGLTPIMAYFVIYLSFLNKYQEDGQKLSLTSSIKQILPYSLSIGAVWIIILIVTYILGVPIGIGTKAVI